MTTLAEFLLARFAGDEAWARDCSDAWADTGFTPGPVPSHPARVLAECEAKRRIVEPWRYDDSQNEDDWLYGIHAAAHEYVLRAHAQSYADHPDFREEWRAG